MKSCPRACNNRTTRENRQTGCEGSRLPFSAARETPRGFLPALFLRFQRNLHNHPAQFLHSQNLAS
jgi:hypothetical protein